MVAALVFALHQMTYLNQAYLHLYLDQEQKNLEFCEVLRVHNEESKKQTDDDKLILLFATPTSYNLLQTTYINDY